MVNSVSSVNCAYTSETNRNYNQNQINVNTQTNVSNLKLQQPLEQDVVSFSKKDERTLEEKQAIVKKARNYATAITFLPIISAIPLAYYSLRSDEKIAKKYDLDIVKDKELIDKIRKTQVKWTIPSIFGLGIPTFIISVLSKSSNIEV